MFPMDMNLNLLLSAANVDISKVMSAPSSVNSICANTVEAEESEGEGGRGDNSSASASIPPSNSRLARNRKTARLRRERKKQEAEQLTKDRHEVFTENELLKEKMLLLPSSVRAELEVKLREEKSKNLISGCLFCDKQFAFDSKHSEGVGVNMDMSSEIMRHYSNEHPHDLKSGEGYLGEFVHLLNYPLLLLEHIKALSQENLAKSGHQQSEMLNASNQQAQRKMSTEEKRRRRLERNAESARLCRQRKKLYIQRIRLELPTVKKENEVINAFLADHEGDESSVDSVIKSTLAEASIPRMNGWDSNLKKSKRNLSYGNLSEVNQPKQFVSPPPVSIQPSLNAVTLASLLELNQTLSNLVLANTLQTALSGNQLMNNNLWTSINTLGQTHPFPQNDVFEAAFALSNMAKPEGKEDS